MAFIAKAARMAFKRMRSEQAIPAALEFNKFVADVRANYPELNEYIDLTLKEFGFITVVGK